MISSKALKSMSAAVLAASASTFLFAAMAGAHAGDHWPIEGDQLKMRWTESGQGTKFQFKTKDQININLESLAEDPTLERSTLIVRGSGANPGSTGVIELPAEYWKRIGKDDEPAVGWKFKGSPFYSGGVSSIQIKNGKTGGSLRIKAKDYYWPFQILAAQDSVEVVLTIGGFAYCAEFSAATLADFSTNEAGEIVAELAAAPGECPQICGNGILESPVEQCDDGNFIDNDTCTNTCQGCDPNDVEYASTFEAIQHIIFDSPVYSCSSDACHGTSLQKGLDLRDGASYDMLVNHASVTDPDIQRVYPGDKDLSLLYLNLAKKLYGSTVITSPGQPMPQGATPGLTEDHLEAIRLWIHGGAPETGVVQGTAELLGSCLPEATPLDIQQPPIPDPAEGTQLAMPGYLLQSHIEIEGCVATYYDVSATVPPSMMVDCPGVFPGTNETGLNAGKCFSYVGNQLFQDAQSHHSIVHIYTGDYSWTDAGWGTWRCYGGDTPDAACDPTISGDCGMDGEGNAGVCGSRFHQGVACLDTTTSTWGAPDFQTSDAPQFSGSQETTADQHFPPGVYGLLPLKGLVVWNSHAFNTTNYDTAMEAWINLTYTDQRTWPAEGLFDSRWIFTQNVPPFESREYCATHTFAEGTRLFNLSSHTHKRGVRWRYYAPPQTPCNAPGPYTSAACLPGDDEDIFYASYDYSDPVTLLPATPIHFTGTTAERTIKFCSVYDNGTPAHPDLIKRQSLSPVPTGNLLVGGPCGDDTVACLAGVNKGQLCHGNDSECPGSTCDACPLLGGVTTEDEMYIAIGTFYIDP